jgi:hypothetical protein
MDGVFNMASKNFFTIRNAAFVILFVAIALAADRVNVAAIWGATGQTFTLFQMMGPLPGFFLGPVLGVVSVLAAEIVNFVLLGKTVELVNLVRLLPMLGAAYYFATFGKNKYALAIPLLAMVVYNLNPVGAQAWAYSLFWLIPVICEVFFRKSLFFRALGSTFVAHSIGSSLWGWFVPMTPEVWMALIPVVIVERLAFAIGITVSFIAVNAVLNRFFADSKVEVLNIEKNISLF